MIYYLNFIWQLYALCASMFQSMQDDVPIEVVKIKVAPASIGFVHQFSNYSLSNIEGASKSFANRICKYN